MSDAPKECRTCGTENTIVQLDNGAIVICCPACYYRESGCLEAGIVAKNRRIRELERAAMATDAQIADLQEENERLTEIVADNPSKWGFDALVYMAKRMLDTNYPASLFGDGARFGDCSGARLVTALRNAIEEVNQLTPTRGTAAEEKK